MATLNWSLNLQISGNTPMTVACDPQEIEATDRIEVEVKPGEKDKVVNIQPGEAGAVQVLLIKSSCYGKHLTVQVTDGGTDQSKFAKAIELDSPQIFSGGSIALFKVAPKQLVFTNSGSPDKTAKLEILVGRDATP